MRWITRCLLPALALTLSQGCYNPSFDGPGGFRCNTGGEQCPEGYSCCKGAGGNTCHPTGQCDGVGKEAGVPDQKVPAEQGAQVDGGGVSGPCNYNEQVYTEFKTTGLNFASVVLASGAPHVFHVNKVGSIFLSTRDPNQKTWQARVVNSGPTTALAAAVDSNDNLHLALRILPKGSNYAYLHTPCIIFKYNAR